MQPNRYACHVTFCLIRPHKTDAPSEKVREIRPDLMFVHGEQADTILASLLALMASLHSLPHSQTVTCPTCSLIIAKPQKIHLVLLSDTAHPKISSRKSRVTRSFTGGAKTPVRKQQDERGESSHDPHSNIYTGVVLLCSHHLTSASLSHG